MCFEQQKRLPIVFLEAFNLLIINLSILILVEDYYYLLIISIL